MPPVGVTPIFPAGAQDVVVIKRISWAAVFAGVLVALAVEILFLIFGVFIGLQFSSPTGVSAWSVAWYFVTSFVALFVGGWVAARLSGNPANGRLHGMVTWGLTTVTTFAFVAMMSWGVVTQSLGLVRTAAIASAPAVAETAPNVPPSEASRMANEAQQQAAAVAQNAAGAIAALALVAWIGILIGWAGSVVGGGVGSPRDIRPVEAPRPAA
jgi:hypothetical protein